MDVIVEYDSDRKYVFRGQFHDKILKNLHRYHYIKLFMSKTTHVYTNFDIEEERIVKLLCFEIFIT